MAKILIVDDDATICCILAEEIKFLGHEARTSFTLREGREMAVSGHFDVVFLDVRLPDGNGLDILPAIYSSEDAPEVIIMTGTGDADGAEMAIKSGAWDYIEKPSSLKQMTLPLLRALEYRKARLTSRTATVMNMEGIIGSSPQMQVCYDLLAQSVNSDANTLITGETGTGKEVFALAVHRNSRRAKHEFVVVDCGAMTETLVESALFGHEKGAFTGAEKQRVGLLKHADGGTVFLDEVGELPLSIQRSLLRALQERRFRPVGSDRETESNFRLIAATNRDLDDMAKQGLFREDLLHRLRSLAIHLPPLREREGDVRDLATHFVAVLCDRYKIKTKGVSPDFLDALGLYPWPGNVRELRHILEETVARSLDVSVLYRENLPAKVRIGVARASFPRAEDGLEDGPGPTAAKPEGRSLSTFKDYMRQSEERYLEELIRLSKGNIKEACNLSGMSRSKIYLLLKTFRKSLYD